jgi:CubicO group peptidase (beta-lactamase class C family)
MQARYPAIFSAILLLVQTPASGDDAVARIESSIEPMFRVAGDAVPAYTIEERMEALGINGFSVAVVINGEVSWAKGYGVADVSERRLMDPATLLLAGSISKPVAALRTHQLAEAGSVSLDTNVNDYLKSWKVPENRFTSTEKVTLRRILNHTAGLTVWGFPGYDSGDEIPSVVEVLDGKGNTDPVRVFKTPGESWR